MTPKRDVVVVAVRLLALYVVFELAKDLPGQIAGIILFPAETDAVGIAVLISGLVRNATRVAIGMCLWFWSFPIANAVCRGLNETPSDAKGVPLVEVQIVAVSVLGLFILSEALSGLANLITTQLFPRTNPRYVYSLELNGKASAQIPLADWAQYGLKTILGFWLLFGSNGIVSVVRTFWERGKTLGSRAT